MIFKHLIAILVLLQWCAIFSGGPAASAKKTTKSIKCGSQLEMDRQIAKLYTYGHSGRPFPENFADFKSYCSETQALSKQFETYYKSCLKSNEFTRSMLSIMMNTIRRESKIQCRRTADGRPSKKQEKLIGAAVCANSVKEAHQRCINQATYFITDTISMKENRRKLAYICCNMNRMEECIYNAMATSSLPVCNPEKAQTSVDFLNSVQGNLMNFLCAEYSPESDSCAK